MLLVSVSLSGQAIQKVYIGTVNNLGNWEVRSNGSGWMPPKQVINSADPNGPIGYNDWTMGLSYNGSSNGGWDDRFDPSGWNGVWFARTSFDLPSWANYAVLLVQPIVRQQPDSCCGRYIYAADDSVVLALNNYFGLTSATVGWTLSQVNNPINRLGVQNSAEFGNNNLPYNFVNRSQMYIIDQLAFKFGQTNWIYLTINNTGTYNVGANSKAWTDTDITVVGVDVWVLYGDRSQFPLPGPSH